MKITLNEFRKLIKEKAAKLLEIDITDDNTQQSAPENHFEEPADVNPDMPSHENLINYSTLSPSVEKLSHKFSPSLLGKLGLEITNIVETGKGKHTHENSIRGKADEIQYITSVLAILYKTANESEKKNIRDYFFVAFTPYMPGKEKASTLARMIGRKAGIQIDLRFNDSIDADYYLGIVADAIYASIDKALQRYSGTDTPFGFFFTFMAVNKTRDEINKSKYKTALTGFGKTSADEPIDSDDEGGETMAGQIENPKSTEEKKEGIVELKHALDEFLKVKLSAPKHQNYLEFYNLFSNGSTFNDIEEITGKNVNNLRIIKMRLEDYISQFVQNGELQKFIKDTTGKTVKFPNDKFSLSAKSEEEAAPEPVYIWKQDPTTDDVTKGEWIDITPKQSKMDKTWFDSYGDLAGFGSGETTKANPDEEEPGIEEPLTAPETPNDQELYRETEDVGRDNIYEVKNLIKKIFFN